MTTQARGARPVLASCCALFEGDVPTPTALAGYAGGARLAPPLRRRVGYASATPREGQVVAAPCLG